MKTRKFTLQQYAALAGGILASANAAAQTEYYEFDPYLPLTFNEDVIIDVDSDGVEDFSVFFRKEWSISTGYGTNHYSFYVDALNGNEMAMIPLDGDVSFTYSSASCYFPSVNGVMELNGLALISPTDEWGIGSVMARGEECTEYAFIKQGDWAFTGGQRDRFIGFRLADPDYFYGWMRVRHNDFGNIDYIKDVAISSFPNTPISTPDLAIEFAPAPGSIDLFYEAGVLKVSFPRVADETKIEDYRIILRDAVFVSDLLSTDCDVTQPENYIKVEKTAVLFILWIYLRSQIFGTELQLARVMEHVHMCIRRICILKIYLMACRLNPMK